MDVPERSFGNVVEDIIDNFQAITRAEVRLAKTEFQQALNKRQSAALVLALGALAGIYALFFVLLAAVFALSLKIPNWMAALVVAFAVAVCAWITAAAGIRKFRQAQLRPKTGEILKE